MAELPNFYKHRDAMITRLDVVTDKASVATVKP
jgi:hypothetical protein